MGESVIIDEYESIKNEFYSEWEDVGYESVLMGGRDENAVAVAETAEDFEAFFEKYQQEPRQN